MYLSHKPRIAFLLALLSLWLGSCGEGLNSRAETPEKTGALTVYLTSPGQPDFSARTLVPQDTGEQYVRLTFSPLEEGVEAVEAETEGDRVIVQLGAGTWNISAQGWHSKGDWETMPDVVILKGQGQVRITADEVLDASVVLYPVGTGTGLLSYRVQVPGDAVSALVRVYALPEDPESPAEVLDLYTGKETAADGTLILSGELSLNTGFYRAALDISRSGEGGVLRKNDTVHIYDGFTTQGTYTLSSGDFSPGETFTGLDTLKTYLAGMTENTPDTPYLITLNMPLSSLGQGDDDLGGLFDALSRYAAIDLRPCTVDKNAITSGPGNAQTPRAKNSGYLTSLFLPEGITELGEYALYSCGSLEYLSLPQTLTSIGNAALRYVVVRSLSIPQGVKSLGNSAFADASRLQSLDLSSLTLNTLGSGILSGCSSLENVILPASLPDKALPDGTFVRCIALESVNLPADLETIGVSAFDNCSALRNMELPPSLKTVKQYGFSHCAVFTPDIGSLTVLETLGDGAFSDCKEIQSLRLPASVATLGRSVFESCEKLTLVELPSSLVSRIDSSTFAFCRNLNFKVDAQEPSPLLMDQGILRAYPGALGEVVLPEGITEIMNSCFRNSTGITSISLPASLETIGISAFDGCTNLDLKPVPVNSSLKTIDFGAFSRTKIQTIRLPASLETIGNMAFYDCTALQEVVCNAPSVTLGGTMVFTQTAADLKIYVPDANVDAYKAADNWKDLSAKIYGLSARS
jgi:hypothetical protein